MRHKHATIFRQPVDPTREEIPDYLEIIKHPMDFSTIKKKLSGNVYLQVIEFLDDIQLTFDNCLLYNGETNQIATMCKSVREEYNK